MGDSVGSNKMPLIREPDSGRESEPTPSRREVDPQRQNWLSLYFEGDADNLRLERSVFQMGDAQPFEAKRCSEFGWTSGVRALMVLLVRSAAWALGCKGEENAEMPFLIGYRKSLACTLD